MKILAGRPFARALALAACFAFLGAPTLRADLIPSSPGASPAGTTAGDEARETVESRLAGFGLTADEAADRLAQLDEQDLQQIADAPEQVQIAGNGIGLGLILIGVGVVLFVLLWLIGTEKINL